MLDRMNDQPLFSIVTPTLNRAQLLEHTVRSISEQTYPRVEHIVIDGGSTDETTDVLRRYEGRYNLRWVSEPDSGMYQAINRGMRLASGEILAYLNSDDLYFPWTLEVVAKAFHDKPNADAVFGDVINIDDETANQRLFLFQPFNLDFIRRTGYLVQPGVFWRRRLYQDQGPFDESLRYVADCDYWMRAGANHTFVKVNEFLAVERNHGSTLHETDGARLESELETVRARYVSLSGPAHEKAVRRNLIIAKIWYRVLWTMLAFQVMVPARIRRGPWSRLLATHRPVIRRSRILLHLVPRLGRRFAEDIVVPDRYWLDRAGQ